MNDTERVLGMIMLRDKQSFSSKDMFDDYEKHYGAIAVDKEACEGSVSFLLEGETVFVIYVDAPIPGDDIEGTAQYAYNWKNALEQTKIHEAHIILSVSSGSVDFIKRFKLFTNLICSLLRTTDAIGVYIGEQSLLIPKKDYLLEAAKMLGKRLPLNLWIYFGLRTTEKGQSGYTYGLRAFGKTEVEVLYSSKTLYEIRQFLFNIAHYVLEYDVFFSDGQTCGFTENEKIEIKLSKGHFVEGESFKLLY